MSQSKSRAEEAIARGKQQIDEYRDVQEKYDTFSKNLAIAKSILSKDIHYSGLAIRIAQALPSGVILNSLTLDVKQFGKPMVLDAAGRSYVDAVRLKTALEKNKLFKDVNISAVTSSKDGNAAYPFQIKMNVTIAPEEITNG
ncbi:MAG: PilN domain-containing protein [Candidatus Saccharibacteria bacterium]|nr:PilN domain-containing protein [Candidatus Saccharibacteria bacterium]